MIKRGFYTDKQGEQVFVQGVVEIKTFDALHSNGVLFHNIKQKPKVFQAIPEYMFLNEFTEGLK